MSVPYGPITLQTGAYAYFDSFAGLVPCVVESIRKTEFGHDVTLRVTGRGNRTYPRGSRVETSARHAVPSKAVYVPRGRCGQYAIRGYAVVADATEVTL